MKSGDQKLINPLLLKLHTQRIKELLSVFPMLHATEDTQFISLWKYLETRPQRFFSTDTFQMFLDKLIELDREHKDALFQLLDEHNAQINNAYRHVNEICAFDWHDEQVRSRDNYGRLVFIDQDLHSAYLRLAEAVFRPLLRIVAHFSRLDRGKSVEDLDLYQIVQELESTNFRSVLSPYDHLMRNGIAHGGVIYSADSVIYEDKKGNRQELDNYRIIRKFDDLLDVCNGLLLAFSIFIFTRKDDRYRLPVNLLIEELRAETKTPYWEVDGCLPSTQINGTQLIIYARINTMDERKVNFSLFQTAIMVEKIAPGYDRYFFSLRSEKHLPGFAAFDGGRLAEHRVKNSQLDQYGDVLEDNLLFFVPKLHLPRILKKVETLWLSYKIHKPSIASDIRQQLGWINVDVRNTEIHRNAWGVVLNADVVIAREVGIVDQRLIKRSCRRVVKKALKEARGKLSFLNVCRYLPLGFCRISVYQRDYRARRLSGFGLGTDLICTVQVQRIRRIKSPDIAGATVEVAARYRIAWNRSWLEEVDRCTNDMSSEIDSSD